MRRLALLVPLAACAQPAAPRTPPHFEVLGTPELVAPGIVSTGAAEIKLAVSPDGATMLWGSPDRPGGAGGWDIWLTHKTAAGWSAPVPAPFDSPANDFDPSFSPDGKTVYFFSNRDGNDDLYRAPLAGGPAEHLASPPNTAGDEWAPVLSRDGKTLLYASNLPGKRHDLYLARVSPTGAIEDAHPVPGALNTDDDDFDGAFLADGTTIVFARSKDVENAPIALYISTKGPDGNYLPATPLPASIDVEGGYTLGPSIDPRDPHVLYFSSHRPEGGAGKLDLYRVRYAL